MKTRQVQPQKLEMVPVTEIRITDPMTHVQAVVVTSMLNNRGPWIATTSIQIINQDTNNETYYLNHLITIVEGEGSGQYAYITSYDWNNGGATAVLQQVDKMLHLLKERTQE